MKHFEKIILGFWALSFLVYDQKLQEKIPIHENLVTWAFFKTWKYFQLTKTESKFFLIGSTRPIDWILGMTLRWLKLVMKQPRNDRLPSLIVPPFCSELNGDYKIRKKKIVQIWSELFVKKLIWSCRVSSSSCCCCCFCFCRQWCCTLPSYDCCFTSSKPMLKKLINENQWEPSPQSGSTGPRWKAVVVIFDVRIFFKTKEGIFYPGPGLPPRRWWLLIELWRIFYSSDYLSYTNFKKLLKVQSFVI